MLSSSSAPTDKWGQLLSNPVISVKKISHPSPPLTNKSLKSDSSCTKEDNGKLINYSKHCSLCTSTVTSNCSAIEKNSRDVLLKFKSASLFDSEESEFLSLLCPHCLQLLTNVVKMRDNLLETRRKIEETLLKIKSVIKFRSKPKIKEEKELSKYVDQFTQVKYEIKSESESEDEQIDNLEDEDLKPVIIEEQELILHSESNQLQRTITKNEKDKHNNFTGIPQVNNSDDPKMDFEFKLVLVEENGKKQNVDAGVEIDKDEMATKLVADDEKVDNQDDKIAEEKEDSDFHPESDDDDETDIGQSVCGDDEIILNKSDNL